ncbi:MAG: flagellar hook-basal body complex protein FliE [Baekduia sp.]
MPIDGASGIGAGSGEWAITNGPSKAEWTTDQVAEGAASDSGVSFGSILSSQLANLQTTQTEAAKAAQALATGESTDPSAAIVAVDRARLSMQMASTIRQKSLEAIQDVLRTQI